MKTDNKRKIYIIYEKYYNNEKLLFSFYRVFNKKENAMKYIENIHKTNFDSGFGSYMKYNLNGTIDTEIENGSLISSAKVHNYYVSYKKLEEINEYVNYYYIKIENDDINFDEVLFRKSNALNILDKITKDNQIKLYEQFKINDAIG